MKYREFKDWKVEKKGKREQSKKIKQAMTEATEERKKRIKERMSETQG